MNGASKNLQNHERFLSWPLSNELCQTRCLNIWWDCLCNVSKIVISSRSCHLCVRIRVCVHIHVNVHVHDLIHDRVYVHCHVHLMSWSSSRSCLCSCSCCTYERTTVRVQWKNTGRHPPNLHIDDRSASRREKNWFCSWDSKIFYTSGACPVTTTCYLSFYNVKHSLHSSRLSPIHSNLPHSPLPYI